MTHMQDGGTGNDDDETRWRTRLMKTQWRLEQVCVSQQRAWRRCVVRIGGGLAVSVLYQRAANSRRVSAATCSCHEQAQMKLQVDLIERTDKLEACLQTLMQGSISRQASRHGGLMPEAAAEQQGWLGWLAASRQPPLALARCMCRFTRTTADLLTCWPADLLNRRLKSYRCR